MTAVEFASAVTNTKGITACLHVATFVDLR